MFLQEFAAKVLLGYKYAAFGLSDFDLVPSYCGQLSSKLSKLKKIIP